MKKVIRIGAVIVALVVGIYVWQNFLKTAPSMKRLDAEYQVTAIELSAEYEESEDTADAKYRNKIIELTGELESIETPEGSLPVLNLKTEGFGMVKCTMESDLSSTEIDQLEINSTVSIRGECYGLNLFDIQVGRSIIINN